MTSRDAAPTLVVVVLPTNEADEDLIDGYLASRAEERATEPVPVVEP